MSVVDLGTKESFGFDKDPIVIRNYVAGIKGGKVLDVDGFTPEFIKAGHVIIKETATDTYKPMPVSGNAYAELPSGHEYVGVAYATKAKSEPFVAIMYSGTVNDVASPYPVDGIKAALKTALPTLVFNHD